MNTGKPLFAQLMDFLPWTTFTRIVDRYGGDHRVRTLSCAEQYRSMAFAQLTSRESLRDIETCLSVHASKLYHMGFRQPVRRSTLADANERRDWRIHAALAQRLITQARTLYVDEELGLDLTNTVYALDSTTIALCLSVFPWAHFRTTKAAVKMHTLLDLRGNIPSFIHISDGKLHDVHALDMLLPEAGAIYVVDRGYVDFARLYVLHQAGALFVTRATSNIDAHRVYSAPTDRSTGIICDQTISLDGFYTRQDYPELLRRIRFKDPESGKTLVFITNNFSLPAATICALYKSRWQVELFFKWIKQHLRIKQFYGTSENAVKTQIWIAVSVYRVTDAAVHDSQVVEDILDPDNTASDVWADSAYRSAEIEAKLEDKGLKSRIHRKGHRDKPLSEREKRGNKTRSRVRARVEHVFGAQSNDMGGTLVRGIGLVRARARIGLKNLAYNMRRLVQLERLASAAPT